MMVLLNSRIKLGSELGGENTLRTDADDLKFATTIRIRANINPDPTDNYELRDNNLPTREMVILTESNNPTLKVFICIMPGRFT